VAVPVALLSRLVATLALREIQRLIGPVDPFIVLLGPLAILAETFILAIGFVAVQLTMTAADRRGWSLGIAAFRDALREWLQILTIVARYGVLLVVPSMLVIAEVWWLYRDASAVFRSGRLRALLGL
jgi:hypothetical protein